MIKRGLLMNELIFLLQTVALVGALFWAVKIGKEALIALCVLLSVLANFFVLQQMLLLGYNVTCSDAFAIGSIFGLNLIQQAYGRDAAKKTIWISFFGMLFFTAFSQIHLLYIPSPYDTSREHFSYLLSFAPRLMIASVATFFITQQFDVMVYGFFQKRLSAFSWQSRSTLSLLLSQAVDTLLFSFLGLYGIVHELGSVILVSYIVKCAIILLTSLSARFFGPLRPLTPPDPSL